MHLATGSIIVHIYIMFVNMLGKRYADYKVDWLSVKDMWRYVENVVGLEVLSRQIPVRDTQDSDHDVEILLQQLVSKKPCLSKVLQLRR